MANTLSSLDHSQVLRIAFDEASGALKTIPSTGTVTVIQLSADQGDSIGIEGVQTTTSANIASTGATGVLIGPLSCSGMRSFQLYSYTAASGATGAIANIDYSPDGIHFLASNIAVTSSTSLSGMVVSSLDSSHIAQSVRVSVTQLPSSGSANYYLIMQGN